MFECPPIFVQHNLDTSWHKIAISNTPENLHTLSVITRNEKTHLWFTPQLAL